jgi:hypothetical protein
VSSAPVRLGGCLTVHSVHLGNSEGWIFARGSGHCPPRGQIPIDPDAGRLELPPD